MKENNFGSVLLDVEDIPKLIKNKNKKMKKKKRKAKVSGNKKVIVAGVLGLALAAGVISASAASMEQMNGAEWRKNKPEFSQGNNKTMIEIMDNADYGAWKKEMAGKPIAEKITEEDFLKLVEAHKLAQAGDFEGAKEIRKELGMGQIMGRQKNGLKAGLEKKQAMMDIMDSANYEAWQEIMSDSPVAEKIDEAGFAKLVEAHKLMQAGDYEGAKEIKDELGMGLGYRGSKMGQRKGNGDCQKNQ